MLSIHLFSFLILIIACTEDYNNIHLIRVLFSLSLLSSHKNICKNVNISGDMGQILIFIITLVKSTDMSDSTEILLHFLIHKVLDLVEFLPLE